MSTQDIIRAWKDEEFRSSLDEAALAALPQHPAGLIELDDAELDIVAGGMPRRSDLSSMLQTCTSSPSCCC